MSSEKPKLNDSEENENLLSGAQPSAPQPSQTNAEAASTAAEDDEPRPGGDVDFGQLLDQFEQEQATLQEGEVVRGTVVDGFSYNFRVLVPHDAVYDRTETVHKVNLFDMAQKYADVASTTDVLAELATITSVSAH